ncbi:hypothetical protein, partial [Alkalihalobacillus sp. TS-13]|uniref:hypothetical protein n=1 Tax=Alkalihalobacillus sp. TS-13 TaxID=2842455 RepID=UPI001C885353
LVIIHCAASWNVVFLLASLKHHTKGLISFSTPILLHNRNAALFWNNLEVQYAPFKNLPN